MSFTDLHLSIRCAALAASLVACGGTSQPALQTAPSDSASAPAAAPDAAGGPQGGASATTAFVGVAVVPMDSERILRAHTVVTRGDRIVAMGPSQDIEVPAGAEVIDGRGKYLLPGLIDMHVHLATPEAPSLFVANGVTAVRNMWGTPELLTLNEQILAGALVGPSVYSTGPIIDGEPMYWEASEKIVDPAQADALVAAHQSAGYDGVKLYMNLREPVYRALVAAARARGIRSAAHVPSAVGMDVVLEQPVDSLEHLWGYFLTPSAELISTDPLVVIRAEAESWLGVTPAQMQALAARLADKQVYSCATLHLRRQMGLMGAPNAFAGVDKRYVSPFLLSVWTEHSPYTKLGERDFQNLLASHRQQEIMVRALRDAGAKLLIGTDTPNPGMLPGFSVHDELANFVDAGLSPYEALRAGTHDAAEYLGALDEIGTVAVGRRADLLLLSGDPLRDIGNSRDITGVMVRGTWHSRAALDQLLTEVEAMIAAAPAPSTDGHRH
ncbi:MAG: amidohydrolase family protein [Haliangiales bacterium]